MTPPIIKYVKSQKVEQSKEQCSSEANEKIILWLKKYQVVPIIIFKTSYFRFVEVGHDDNAPVRLVQEPPDGLGWRRRDSCHDAPFFTDFVWFQQ